MTASVTPRQAVTAADDRTGWPLPATPDQVPDRHLYRVTEAMALLSMSRSALYEQIRSGRLLSVKVGRARLIPAKTLDDFVNLLISESEEEFHGQAA